jgi:hypothetical protein
MVVESFFADARDFKYTSAMNIRTSDLMIRTDPVIRMRHSLLNGNNWNQGSKAVYRKALTLWQRKVFARKQERITDLVVDHVRYVLK